MSRKPLSIWTRLRVYINTQSRGDRVTRLTLMQEVLEPSESLATLDGYRRVLTLLNCLETVKPGTYKVLNRIPNLSSSEAKRKAYAAIGR